MMTYRIVPTEHAHDMSGSGSATEPGRWNIEGVAALYTSSTRALAICESLLGSSSTKADELALVTYEFSDHFPVLCLEVEDLPPNWPDSPPPTECQELGSRHLNCDEYVAFRVPSSIVPEEYNYVLNPRFKQYDQVQIVQTDPFDTSHIQL